MKNESARIEDQPRTRIQPSLIMGAFVQDGQKEEFFKHLASSGRCHLRELVFFELHFHPDDAEKVADCLNKYVWAPYTHGGRVSRLWDKVCWLIEKLTFIKMFRQENLGKDRSVTRDKFLTNILIPLGAINIDTHGVGINFLKHFWKDQRWQKDQFCNAREMTKEELEDCGWTI